MKHKKCCFKTDIETYYTYSSEEYDRKGPMDSLIYRRAINRITGPEIYAITIELLKYKKYEMVVHIENVIQ